MCRNVQYFYNVYAVELNKYFQSLHTIQKMGCELCVFMINKIT